MDAKPYVDRLLDDEGLCGGLPDDAAQALVQWAIVEIRKTVEPLKDPKSAEAAVHGHLQLARGISRTAEAIIDGNVAKAKAAWQAAGGSQPLEILANQSPVQIVAQLLAWKATAHA